MSKCKDCIFWERLRDDQVYNESFDGLKMGWCNNKNIKINPNYYTEYEGESADDMALTTYTMHTGQNFGCIHFKPKDNE